MAHGAWALECPAPVPAQAWHQFGCEMGGDDGLVIDAASQKKLYQGDPWEASVHIIDALVENGRVARLHYQSGGQDIVAGMNGLLIAVKSPVLTSQEADEIVVLTANTGEPVVDAEPYLEKIAATRGKHLILIDTSTDFDSLAMLDDTLFCRWNRVNLASGVSLSQVTAVGVGEDYFDALTWPFGPRECEGTNK